MDQTIFNQSYFSGIELRQVISSSDYEPHMHDTYSIGLLIEGAQQVRTGRKFNTVVVGTVLSLEPYQVHENRRITGSGFSFRNFDITGTRLTQMLDRQALETRANHIEDAELYQALMRAYDVLTLNENTLAQDEALTGAFSRLFPARASSFRQPDLTPRLVNRLRDYLHAHYTDPITLDSLVDLAQVSRVHISRIFKQHVGLAPHQYLVQLRIASAKSLLAQGVPVVEVAALTGFADQSHFTRHFKRVTHLTPGAWAQSCYKRSRR
jgi:AraC-like DNA-binding protein